MTCDVRGIKRPLRLATAALALIAVCVGVSACGSSNGSGSGSAGGTSADAPSPASGCGSYALAPAPDPQGLLKKLGKTYQDALAGSTTPVTASGWSNWKPKHGPPYTVGIQWNQETNDYQTAVTRALKKQLAADPQIGKVIYQTTGSSLDVGAEIQQLNSLLQKKPDIVILQPLTGPSFTSSVNTAAKAGVPTISAMSTIPSKYAVSVHPNDQFNGAVTMAKLMQITGGKGNLYLMHAIPGETSEINTVNAAKAALKRCPDMKLIGEGYGSYNNGQAKSETLKFLSTHPQKIAAVFQTAVMAPGIMSAFEQTGRPVPPVNDIGNNKGSLGYWRQNAGKYHGVAAALGAPDAAAAFSGIASRMLRGQGIKISDIQYPSRLVTDKNLNDWSEPGWTLATPGIADGPGDQFMTAEFLNGLFNKGATP